MWKHQSWTAVVLAALCCALICAPSAQAQCQLEWQDGPQVPGTDAAIWDMAPWDPDGPGPLTPQLIAIGGFSFAGGAIARGIASLDYASSTWAPVGSGFVGRANCLLTRAGGTVVVGGYFSFDNWATTEVLAEWDGANWSPMASITTISAWPEIHAVATMPNGDFVIAGRFDAVDGVPARNIARWDGGAWHAMGPGANGVVYELAAMPNGEVMAAGDFSSASGTAITGIARWDGQSWHALGSAAPSPGLLKFLPMPNGDLLVGGDFTSMGASSARHIARWDGSSWSALGNGTEFRIRRMMLRNNGDLVVGGWFAHGGTTNMRSVARWNGSTWLPLGNGMGGGAVLAFNDAPDGTLLVGGGFHEVAGEGAMNLVRWDGSNWSAIGHGISGYAVHDVKAAANGDLLVGGEFKLSDSSSANIARWNGSSWQTYGPGLPSRVWAVAELPNGDIVAGGDFHLAAGGPADYIARWNGTSWLPMGSTLDHPVRHLAVMPNGNVLAAGNFAGYIASWDGAAWSTLDAGLSGPVNALLITPYGGCLVGGKFRKAGTLTCNGVALWTGQWLALGSGLIASSNQFVSHLVNTPMDGVLAAGYLQNGTSPGYGFSQWDWNSWQPLPSNGTPWSLLRLPNGDLLAGDTTAAVATGLLSRWNGTAWTNVPWPNTVYQLINHLTARPDGSIAVTASFPLVVRILASACPATATIVGTGCSGSSGHNSLVAAPSLPWTGSDFRTEGRGLTPQSLTLELNGLVATSAPLSAILPEGGTGCSLLTVPDFLRLHVPVASTLPMSTTIPDSIALIGATWYQQLVSLELDPAGGLTLMTSSNALQLQIGSY